MVKRRRRGRTIQLFSLQRDSRATVILTLTLTIPCSPSPLSLPLPLTLTLTVTLTLTLLELRGGQSRPHLLGRFGLALWRLRHLLLGRLL